jgi:dienelactone hydrolase
MKAIIRWLALTIIPLLFASFALAQQPSTASGAYTTYVGDQRFATETYTITSDANGSMKSVADVAFGNTKFRATTLIVNNRPVTYTMEVGGAVSLKEEFTAAGVKVAAMPGQPEKQVKAQPDAILENGVNHQFIFLLTQYDTTRGGAQSFQAFLPSQAMALNVSLERIDSPSFAVAGKQIATEHFRAGTDLGLSFEIWTNHERVPLLIQIAAQRLKIVRNGSEALALVILPPPVTPVASPSDPYTSEEVTFQNGEQKLVGTLTIPKGRSAPIPGVIIITGSGSQDRDGSDVDNIYRLIAERLSSNGLAVLRVDDRGSGKSSIPPKATSYRDLINDTKAAFEFLNKRGEIDHKRIALAGHSEGAETALTIAAEDDRVAAIMLLAGSSRPLDMVVPEQTLYSSALLNPINPADQSRVPTIARNLEELFRKAKSTPKGIDASADQLSYFREHLESDPLALAQRVHVPVLILNGERDPNVLPYHAIELARTVAQSGNKQVLLRIFPNLTHLFMPSRLDKSVTAAQAATVSPQFLDLLQKWATNVLVQGKDGGAIP